MPKYLVMIKNFVFQRVWRENGLNLAILGGLLWASRYVYTPSYGLYEDDLTIIPTAVAMSFPELGEYIWNYITNLYGHARPLSDSFIYLFSNLGWRLADLQGAYILGFLIELLNIFLFYFLILKIADHRLAVLSGMAYSLFSADTTQIFLTHSLGLQPSITLLLLALHNYVSGRRIIAYLLASIILFSYETPFLVFLAAPFLQKIWGKSILKEIGAHIMVVGAILLAVFQLRVIVADDRVLGITITETIKTSVEHMIQGSATSLYSYIYRPYQVAHWLDIPAITIGIICSFFVILGWMYVIKIHRFEPGAGNTVHEALQPLWKPGLAGLVMLSMAYPLTFTVRPFILAGRETRAHSAAVVGAALVVGVILYLLIAVAERIRLKALVPIGLAGLFSLLVGFGFSIQQDYRQAWQFQRDFWTKLLPLIQDVGPGTVILVDNAGLSEPAQIQANTWNLPRTLHQIYTFPVEWDGKHPGVFRLSGGWENTLVSPEHPQMVHISSETVQSPSAFYQDINSDNVILINTNEGVFTRHFTPLDLGEVTVVFKTQDDQVLNQFPTGFLYPYLNDPEK